MRASKQQHLQPHPESEHFTSIAAVDTIGVEVIAVVTTLTDHSLHPLSHQFVFNQSLSESNCMLFNLHDFWLLKDNMMASLPSESFIGLMNILFSPSIYRM
jgi:hypothetical protein